MIGEQIKKAFGNQSSSEEGPVWSNDLQSIPWFDRPDAMDHLDRIVSEQKIAPEDQRLLEKWVTDGYFTIDDGIDRDLVRRIVDRTEEIWFASSPIADLAISDVVIGGKTHIHIPHCDLIEFSEEERRQAMAVSHWRILQLHLFDPLGELLFQNENGKRLCNLVLQRPTHPSYSLTFAKGSLQHLHDDSSVFHIHPRNNIIGMWIAGEDIKPDSGPLVYYPGSHREPMYSGFDNYPQTNVRTSTDQMAEDYAAHIVQAADKYEEKLFLPKAGGALFWHGGLIHGGLRNSAVVGTRKSFVIHYIADGCDVSSQISGPFRW